MIASTGLLLQTYRTAAFRIRCMYSWNTVRTACAILLLVPIVHLVYLVSREALATLDASPRVWEREVDAYASIDRDTRQPLDPVLVVGGRRVKLWRGLEDLLAPRPVLMRGLGNATINDILYYYDRLIGFYQPDTLVIMPGNSEFHIRDAKSATELVSIIRTLVEADASASEHGTRKIYVFTPLKTPLFPGDSAKIEKATLLLEEWAQEDKRVAILDGNALLTDDTGQAKPDYYRSDGTNLNEHGYLRLSLLLQTQIELDTKESAVEEG